MWIFWAFSPNTKDLWGFETKEFSENASQSGYFFFINSSYCIPHVDVEKQNISNTPWHLSSNGACRIVAFVAWALKETQTARPSTQRSHFFFIFWLHRLFSDRFFGFQVTKENKLNMCSQNVLLWRIDCCHLVVRHAGHRYLVRSALVDTINSGRKYPFRKLPVHMSPQSASFYSISFFSRCASDW